jgi:ATP-dependent exoDNAse (exonuclease V) beta subunit
MSTRVIRAAAGCGKTTALATAYLGLVADGVPVDRIIAITFTRRAAAELVERVGLALRAAIGDPEAHRRLGRAADAYVQAAPRDRERAIDALADLGSAPIGTTDHFVHLLLAEFALDAEVALPDGRIVPLDVGLVPTTDLTAHLDATARRILDPAEGDPPDEVAFLTRYFSLAEILALVCDTSDLHGLEPLPCQDVLQELARAVARRLADTDLAALLDVDPPTPEGFRAALDGITLPVARWTLDAVAAWMAAGAPIDEAPHQLLSWARKIDGRTRVARGIKPLFQQGAIDFGIATVRMDHILAALRHPYEDPAHLELADQLRAAVQRLRVQVTSEALETAALQGELPHEQLTRAAARLARSPVLTGRFGALLVDEVQDADPDQLALYEALAEQPGMTSIFVGDARQSIYLFRGGEPAGLARLTTRAEHDGTVEARLRNYRSTPPLVSAQRVLFAALEQPMLRQFFVPLETLEDLEHAPGLAAMELSPDHHEDPRPVWLVRTPGKWVPEADQRALVAFHERLAAARREPGHAGDTAAVLCPTWAKAREAARMLKKLAGAEDAAYVEGGDGWLTTGVGRDVGVWLRALLDPTDDVAWLAVWKHPAVGLSDAALARVRAGVGMVGRDVPVSLGRLHRVEALCAPHPPADIAAHARAQPALVEALATLGRDDTAEVLDRLLHALDWRVVLAAGPQGPDELARLEVLLDWIGEKDAEGQGVTAIATALGSDARLDVPRVRLERSRTTITCTTVFQAKGLAWDHVAILSPGRAGRLQVDPDDVWVDFGRGRRRLVGLTFDPEGGLLPFQDPLRRLAHTIRKARFAEEGARLAYVALTRARRSVTVALPRQADRRDGRMSDAQRMIAETWPRVDHPAVAVVDAPPLPPASVLPNHAVRPAVDALPPLPSHDRRTLHEMAPSSAAARYSKLERIATAEHVARRVRLANGFRPGGPDHAPPEAVQPDFTPAEWGTLAHGWFAAWGFRGEPTPARISAYLTTEWGRDDPAVNAWLAAVSGALEGRQGSTWSLVTDPASRLLFEYPLVGIGGPRDDLLLSGRIDLLVLRRQGAVVVDFKAGGNSPTSFDDLVSGASLKTYGPQLEAYRGALERMGVRVLATTLWFVRTGAEVSW